MVNAQIVTRNVYADMLRAGITKAVPENATALEVVKAAGLDWQMVDLPLAAMPEADSDNSAMTGTVFPSVYGRFKVSPDGTFKPLAAVGSRTYQLPNLDVFTPFDSLISSGQAKWKGVGSFGGGAKVFGQVEMVAPEGSTFEIAKDDFMAVYPTSINHNDGSGSAAVGLNLTRIVCANTFRMAYGADSMLKMRHGKDIQQKFFTASQIFMEIQNSPIMVMLEKCRFLASKGNITTAKLREFIINVFGMELNDKDKLPKQSESRIDEITRLFESGVGNQGKTWWDATNAMTEFFTYDAGRSVETRLSSLWFGGENAKKSDNAFKLAVEMAA